MKDRTKTSLTEVTFSVPGMMCDGCAEKVRDAVMGVPGVRQAKPSAWHKRVTVTFEASRIEPRQIKLALESAGFETGEVRA
jgi:copper chaperone